MQQEVPITHIKQLLTARYRDRDDVFVSNMVFISYDMTNGNARVQPDLFIAFGVEAATIRENLPNFWIWETGKVPDFVMEVAYPSTARNDLGHKRDLYARLGVNEYWRFDPTGGDLYGQPMIGERLVNGQFQPCAIVASEERRLRFHSALLNVDFQWDGSSFDVVDPETGRAIDPLAIAQDAITAAESQRDFAVSRAEEAEAEVARLRDELDRRGQE